MQLSTYNLRERALPHSRTAQQRADAHDREIIIIIFRACIQHCTYVSCNSQLTTSLTHFKVSCNHDNYNHYTVYLCCELQLHPRGALSVMESHDHSRQVDSQSAQHHYHRQAPQTRYNNRRIPEERLSVRQKGQSCVEDQIMYQGEYQQKVKISGISVLTSVS